jgi:two-component system, NarL family, nitrate/nitrite response regulator NarL
MLSDRAPTAVHPTRREGFVPYGDGIPVLLVSDVKLLRDGLVLVTAGTSAIRVVGTAATLDEVQDALTTLRPAVLLLDMSIPDGVEIASAVRRAEPTVGIVAFAAASDEEAQLACVEAGITGFVPRDGGLRELVEATVRVVQGEIFCSPQVIGSTFRRLAELSAAGRGIAASAPVVSARERQIVDLIDRGLSNKEIAARLQIGLATVKNHVHNILEKLQVARRGEVAARLRETSRRTPRSAPSSDDRPQRRD